MNDKEVTIAKRIAQYIMLILLIPAVILILTGAITYYMTENLGYLIVIGFILGWGSVFIGASPEIHKAWRESRDKKLSG